MPEPVPITEILRRADTGVSVNPFVCRTDEGRQIYVKPSGTLHSSLISEWLGSRLAEAMSLPVASFTLVDVPDELIKAVIGIDTSGLNSGIGFGSYDVGTGSRDMEPGDLDRLPQSILAEILAFDLWIQNGDRILTRQGGNPNIVIGADQDEPFLIDHDNAFDPEFSSRELRNHHLGWQSRGTWLDPIEREIWQTRAAEALTRLPGFFDELPGAWLEQDSVIAENPNRTLDSFCAMLRKPHEEPESFWRPITHSE